MKKVIYGLLIATSITGSAVYAAQPQRPTTPLPTEPAKLSPEVCPPELDMNQLNKIKEGTLTLGGHRFTLHTSKTEFDAMLPSKWQVISKSTSAAHISPKLGKGVVSTPEGQVVKCTYYFRTTLRSAVHIDPKLFSIVSAPQEGNPLPKGLVEAIKGTESTNRH